MAIPTRGYFETQTQLCGDVSQARDPTKQGIGRCAIEGGCLCGACDEGGLLGSLRPLGRNSVSSSRHLEHVTRNGVVRHHTAAPHSRSGRRISRSFDVRERGKNERPGDRHCQNSNDHTGGYRVWKCPCQAAPRHNAASGITQGHRPAEDTSRRPRIANTFEV